MSQRFSKFIIAWCVYVCIYKCKTYVTSLHLPSVSVGVVMWWAGVPPETKVIALLFFGSLCCDSVLRLWDDLMLQTNVQVTDKYHYISW
jgi:hypothetical protein